MKKEANAIYIGKYKVLYRAKRNGQVGLLYKKGDEELFISVSDFLNDLFTGPYDEVVKND